MRGHIGRSWMAIRDMDIAAEIVGFRPLRTKLTAFAVSSFFIGNRRRNVGLPAAGLNGSRWPSTSTGRSRSCSWSSSAAWARCSAAFLGCAFIVLTPILLNQMPGWLGVKMSTALISHLEFMVFGAMIVFFLIVEPHGLARLWAVAKEKLRLWPFPH